jgi:hypothetical protein
VTIAWHPDHFRARRLPDAALVGLLGHLSDARQDDDSERAIIPYRPKRRRNRRPSKFTQRDISRAIRGVEASGKHAVASGSARTAVSRLRLPVLMILMKPPPSAMNGMLC